MGAAARLRVLQGYTKAHVQEVLRGAYLSGFRFQVLGTNP
jgi:hypothetical protein